jgi:hypothetical protein
LTAIGVAVEMPSVCRREARKQIGRGPEHQASAGLVLDDDRLSQRCESCSLYRRASVSMPVPAGERDNDRDRPGGIAIGQGRRVRRRDGECKQSQDAATG